ncbi:hypothetical protein GCM10011331_23950 [Flavimobilis marinus]|uniref:Uncharacterized protein n=1 Tax=Flavimobilis marinus TaxID=285351 RepID=A0A1I2GKA5_9MICO|nr:hypothetical protein [Flavimobilis marinus]GHG56410.1 hypothetical protein GCM10011331_23950 [Flavimobilis marinus]SFF17041.1 hypothetical protein SAMN04488035_1776 [Flavimobilis marinus]
MTEPDDGRSPEEGASPEESAAPRRKHRRVVRPGPEQASVSGLSADERGDGWSEAPDSSRDAEFLRDVPPHWGTKGS